MYAVIGAGRRTLGKEDIHIKAGEADVPRERRAVVDVRIRPVAADGTMLNVFPAGSFWTNIWGTGISPDEEFHDFLGVRMSLAWNAVYGEYRAERKFLKEWLDFANWLDAEEKERVSAAHLEPLVLHYMDAQRDIEDDIRARGSFWRRLTDDLGLSETEVEAAEALLSDLNQQIVGNSSVLQHLRAHLLEMSKVVTADGTQIEIAPVARRLRDLSKGVDVTVSSGGSQAFPLARHGMGTRSLASLLVFRAFASWKHTQAESEGDLIHSVLALEEPEAHLHPQAQRSLFAQVQAIPGQRIVSTHSPYFAGQAKLAQLRLFRRGAGVSSVTELDLSALNPNDIRKLEYKVMLSRGDLLFARAIILFEGETEEEALPIWVDEYWGCSVHQIGYNCIGVGGGDYFPFIWLARKLGIHWYVLSDGEAHPVSILNNCLTRAGLGDHSTCNNVIVLPNGNDFEKQLVEDGYLPEIEAAFNAMHSVADYLTDYIIELDGKPGKRSVTRNYSGSQGRHLAAVDALREQKTRMAVSVALATRAQPDVARRIPPTVMTLFKAMVADGFTVAKPASMP
jgi:putative ATP-dependent endonuclease of OLD family